VVTPWPVPHDLTLSDIQLLEQGPEEFPPPLRIAVTPGRQHVVEHDPGPLPAGG
jgi:hypothetical protein